MQVEHKTEKGTLLFIKLPDLIRTIHVSPHPINPLGNWLFYTSGYNDRCGIPLSDGNWKLIGLTSEVTEEQAKMMVDSRKIFPDQDTRTYLYSYLDYKWVVNMPYWYDNALDSFKSLTQKLEVYEINPYKEDWNELCIWGHGGFAKDGKTEFQLFTEAESRTGKWLVLFKEN